MKSHSSPLTSAAILITSLLMPITSHAESADFNSAFNHYNDAVAQNNIKTELQFAQQAFDLGQIKFGEQDINSANLALNLASAMNKNHQITDAISHYEFALGIYRDNFDDEAIELIDPLTLLAEATKNGKQAKTLFREAIDISENINKPLLHAQTLILAFNRLVNTQEYTRSVKNYLLDAEEIYIELLPEDAADRVYATYLAGTVFLAEKQYTRAEAKLLTAIKQYQVLNYSHPYELSAHAKLVEIYSLQDEASKATEHCLAIGNMQPWNNNQEQTPIFRQNPNYPQSKAKQRKEGLVQISFTIDKNGFVKSPHILMSKGGKAFENESIKALKNWRYAPKFVDGKPVEAKSTVQLGFSIG
ncbi:TonB family protein [Shewanella donghaensis]|uniref:TonB family protein n=1 Tax=Shewanella donghaensis TaxID=238836 RepID=UPI0011821EA6|nr:TonB family protein [Shewanella donghaensis]